jgi:outer membrane protein TolC
MKKHVLFAGLLSMSALSAYAANMPEVVELLPASQIRPLLDQDPSVIAARTNLDAARQESQILDRSPHEWNARASTQRRSVQDGQRYQEWNIGVERTLRLPAKARADRKIGVATVEQAEAEYGEAIHEAAKTFLNLYLDWLTAEQGYLLAKTNREAAQENLAVVDKRVRAGDASRLDQSLSQADLAEQRRSENEAGTLANATWGRLSARFPAMKRQNASMPVPSAIKDDFAFWRERILTESDTLKTAQAEYRKALANAERLRADRTPDPTVGVFSASEVGGREKLYGVSISIPIPGGQRSLQAVRATQLAEVARQGTDLKQRELEAEIANTVVNARGAYESWQIAESALVSTQENARLMQRAYSLGEADLQALLLARRQATAAAQSALTSKAAALKAYNSLVIDAHLVWGLEHD